MKFGLLRRLGRRIAKLLPHGRKAFVQPPFWDLERFRTGLFSSPMADREQIENDFEGYAEGAYKGNGVVFACAQTREMIFSEARFLWRRFSGGIAGDLFSTAELSLLERPWPGGTTGELLSRMDQDVTVAGNFFATVVDDAGRVGRRATGPGRRIARLRPDWVSIMIGSRSGDPNDVDAKIVAYMYEPRNAGLGAAQAEPILLEPDEVCHFSPYPDPSARFRGMSWLTPILREIESDKAATKHKLAFFQNGATLTTVMRFEPQMGMEQVKQFKELYEASHTGADNAYRTLFIGGGADPKVIGTDLKQLDFKTVQGAGETRIAAAAGIHPVIVGLSEGLQGSSLNSGNFNAARRLTADKTMRPLWRIAAASLEVLLSRSDQSVRLWYDDRDIAFLRDDQTDLAEVQAKQAQALRTMLDAGYEPDAAVEYLLTNDLGKLRRRHSGLFSVQLQPPGTEQIDGELRQLERMNGQQAALTG